MRKNEPFYKTRKLTEMDEKKIHMGKDAVDLDLLFKSFNNAATEEEERAIDNWLQEKEENKKTYSEARDLFDALLMEAPVELLGGRMAKSAEKRRKAFRSVLYGIGYAAVLAIFCVIGYNVIDNRVEKSLSETMNTIIVPAGKSMDYVLADGTLIKLNSGARLQFPMVFANDRREVHLDGEAYFNVAHDDKQPFVVRTFASDIIVLGTEFNVNADEDAGVFSAALIEGSIRLLSRQNPGEQIIMRPNEKVTMEKGKLVLKEYGASNDILWTEGILDISGLDFSELMEKLEMAFGVRIIVEREMPSGPVFANAKLRISDGIDKAFEVIGNGVDFTYDKDYKTGAISIR